MAPAAILLAALLGAPAAHGQAGGPAPPVSRSLVVTDVELVDDHGNPLTKTAQEARQRDAAAQLRRQLAERRLYRVVDAAPSHALQERLRSGQEFLYRCDDCAAQIGAQLGVDLVLMPWVQKVSELILNLNVKIYDVRAGKVVLVKSVDMRGNQDESWRRAVHYLVRDMAEKRERDPRYGQ